ncbi:hypothetical protein ACSSUQ_004217 [Yersinia enterocolitica]
MSLRFEKLLQRGRDYASYKTECIYDSAIIHDLTLVDDKTNLFNIESLENSIRIDINLNDYEIFNKIYKSFIKPNIIILYDDIDEDEVRYYGGNREKKLALKLIQKGFKVIMYDGFEYSKKTFSRYRITCKVITYDFYFSDEAIKELDDYLLKERVEIIADYLHKREYEEDIEMFRESLGRA